MVEEAVDKDLSKDLPTGGTFQKSPEDSQDQGSERSVSIYFGERRPTPLDCGMVGVNPDICLWPKSRLVWSGG